MYKVLLVDPEHNTRNNIMKMLDWNHYGFTFQDYAETEISALNLFNERHYSIIIINMTQMKDKGLLVCERIREISSIPILLIGGNKDFQLVRKALNLQVNDYLPNPVNPDELSASLLTVKQAIERKLFSSNRNAKTAKRVFDSPKRTTNIIERVKDFVEEAINENITLKEISDTLHYNCSYLGQKFKSQENMTFNEYLLQRRMEKAKYLLHHTNMKIYEISYNVGYTDLDWFYKKFKLYTGVSASEYRKLQSKAQ
ncbi:helix-turn-helix domain-containing protein [Halalkalibacter sp. APA_J-10(15)]|uniref:response regulator transcription factor n=1 Tax=unclassified Halalkalibacter TaxID=2893063 RepID=UPI001FF2DD71|nr:helix-turn-helix domain-containing protein [Halalkalibacter sp. APA_J-10(15)]MCK0471001.1 DNA-binding response regulator [Halalkalibacter sp. APA_J-10(15)]